MSVTRIATYITRRFSEMRREYKTYGLSEIPGFVDRNEEFRKELLEAAYKLEDLQLRFWLRELGKLKADMPYKLAQYLAFRIRLANRDMPEHRKIPNLEAKLTAKLRNHLLRQGKKLWREITHTAASSGKKAWTESVTEFRQFLRYHKFELTEVGASKEELMRLRALNRHAAPLHGEVLKRPGRPRKST